MDPLAQLNDIHLPNQIHHYPIAFGWWVLAIAVIIALIVLTLKVKQYKQKRKARNQALKHMAKAHSNAEIVSILKWACLQYFPRKTVAPLFGSRFYHFLRETTPAKHQDVFDQTVEDHLTSPYQQISSEIDTDFKQVAVVFLSQALPPKKNTSNTTSSAVERNQHV